MREPSNVSYRDVHRCFYHNQKDGACEIVASTCLISADKEYIVSRSDRGLVVEVLFLPTHRAFGKVLFRFGRSIAQSTTISYHCLRDPNSTRVASNRLFLRQWYPPQLSTSIVTQLRHVDACIVSRPIRVCYATKQSA